MKILKPNIGKEFVLIVKQHLVFTAYCFLWPDFGA